MQKILDGLKAITGAVAGQAAKLVKPFVSLWSKEPVLVILGILIAATAGVEAAQSGLDIGSVVNIAIEAAVAFLIRHKVWSPASVEALGITED